MIKLTVELKDEKFIYSYQVGKGSQSGESPICPESLNQFNLMIKLCHMDYTYREKLFMDKVTAGAYLDRTLKVSHPDLFKKVDDILRKEL